MTVLQNSHAEAMPGEGCKIEKMPGHWVLARLGKRVLRPGGRELTQRMLDTLAISHQDHVVEFAPGMGFTAQKVVGLSPASYVGVDRDPNAAARLQTRLNGDRYRVIQGEAAGTGLPDTSADVVFGEAMLTMQPDSVKQAIVREAARLTRFGGRYAIHEICFTTDSEQAHTELRRDLARVIHHGVQPMTVEAWRSLLESEGFEVQTVIQTPMHLLEPARLIRDEGLVGALWFACNLLLKAGARRRVLEMRKTFRQHAGAMNAISLTAVRR